MNKQSFWYLIRIRYGHQLPQLDSQTNAFVATNSTWSIPFHAKGWFCNALPQRNSRCPGRTGTQGKEKAFYKRLSEALTDDRNENLSKVTTWVRRKEIFALMRSVVLCLRASRVPWSKDHLSSSLTNKASDCESLCSF